MPVSGQYTWQETSKSLVLTVPLKGCSPNKVDIYATDSIIKINYAPYIVDITLKRTIQPDKHKARVKDGILVISIEKADEGIWGELEADPADNIAERRAESIQRQQQAENDMREKQKNRKHDDSRKALRTQMDIEQTERQLLDDLKAEEKHQAEEDMYSALARLNTKPSDNVEQKPSTTLSNSELYRDDANDKPNTISLLDEIDEDSDIEDNDASREPTNNTPVGDDNQNIQNQKEAETMFDDMLELDETTDLQFIPAPRSQARGFTKHSIDFTPRVFPTPLRESKMAEEEDWVARNRKYLKTHGVVGKNLTRRNGANIEDEDPTWLKAKGDDFYRKDDLRSAINAYTAALDTDPSHIPCLINRSACYLRIGEQRQCIGDCTKVLELINATSNGDHEADGSEHHMSAKAKFDQIKQQIKVLARRGAANCQIGEFIRAAEDYKAALSMIHTSNMQEIVNTEQLWGDLQIVELLGDCDNHKKAGDLALSHTGIPQAIEEYTAALELIPGHIACLSNRAAAHLANENYEASAADSALALQYLQQPLTDNRMHKQTTLDLCACIVPAAGTAKRKTWVLRTLTRKAAALVKLGRIDEAIVDYRSAVTLAPDDKALASDLQTLTELQTASVQQE